MADKTKALAMNVPGRFFVDSTCINCDACRDFAPEVFGEAENFAYVMKQPQSREETDAVELALLQCPRGAIGSYESIKIEAQRLQARFPEFVAEDVYYLGYNSPKSFGGKSYLIKHPLGNWMVDSPRFHKDLVEKIEKAGGLKYIFLTHRDDVADADQYASHFGAERIIHRHELSAQPQSEIVLEGSENRSFGEFKVLFTPGHTEGHCMLLYKNKFLFSGDTLTSRHRFGELIEPWHPRVCWFDWAVMIESLEMLKSYDFEWLMPGHGRMARLNPGTASIEVERAVKRAQEEDEPDPATPARLRVFEMAAQYLAGEQKEFYARRAAELRKRL